MNIFSNLPNGILKMMNNAKSTRNKTINTSIEEGQDYLNQCVSISDKVENIQTIKNKTIYGDLFNIIPMLPEKSMDLIIADPPYNLTKKFGENTFNKTNNDEYEQYTRDWLNLVVPLLKDNGSIYICCDWESSLIIGRVLSEYLTVRNRISWQREKGRGAKSNWKNGMEDIWFATKSKQYTFNLDAIKVRRKVIAPYKIDGKPKDWTEDMNGNYRDTCPSNFWDDITIPFWSMPENTAHPTQKPEKLIAKLILASSNQGDIVFDPFLGSGTTSVVAKKLGRNYIGIEKEPQYCIWAEQRLIMAENNHYIQGYTNGVFWERNSLSEQNGQKRLNVQSKNEEFVLIG
ncbi:MAG: site-specific DNA-methyltransferase [Cardiobacteriaceae bacterium]|nr:site-specific DNA-methyltransferase [Cardiobacteriaceae bacterium]